MINEHNLPWEAIPTEWLASRQVWETLIPRLPLNALLRNLGRLTANGALYNHGKLTGVVIKRIAKRAKEEGRSDDSAITVRNRMRVYAEHTAPVADYYAERGLLTRVLGDGSKEEILQRILSVLRTSAASV